MFRKMRRARQALSPEECHTLLEQERRGVLSVIGDDGYPYGMPLNHSFDSKEGKLYFHCAKSGHKIDAIRKNDKVSYCVHDQGFQKDGEWAYNVRSVIVFGRMKEIEDLDRKKAICKKIAQKFTQDASYISKELDKHLPSVNCLELSIEHMTGKLVNES